jgi:hypothetical protein
MGIRITLHHQLVGSANSFKIVLMNKFFTHVLSPTISSSTGRRVEPTFSIISRI